MFIEEDEVQAVGPASAVGGFGLRRGSAEPAAAATPAVADFGSDSYLDIPAFLRRQAD
jgi:cell division protein FtsZ